MGIKVRESAQNRLAFQCPGCKREHEISVNPAKNAGGAGWDWNGSVTQPTFKPSVLSNVGRAHPGLHLCHSFVTGGRIQFLPDSTHTLAGQTVELPDYEEDGMAKDGKGKEVKNAVVDVKCKKSAEECKDAQCPVHMKAETAEKSAEEGEEDKLTPSALAAPAGTVCKNTDGDILCGRPREEHTIKAARGDVAFDHDFVPSYKGDEKVAAAEAAGRAIAESGEKVPLVPEEHSDAPSEDRDLIRFVMSKGYSARGAIGLLASARTEIAADFEKERASDLDATVKEALTHALGLIKHIPHQNDFTKSLVTRIEDILNPPVELMTLQEAKQRLGV
jgi:hypothetical protein